MVPRLLITSSPHKEHAVSADPPTHENPVTVSGINTMLTALSVQMGRIDERVKAHVDRLETHIHEEEGDFADVRSDIKSLKTEMKLVVDAVNEIHSSLRTIRWIALAVAGMAGMVGALFGHKAGS